MKDENGLDLEGVCEYVVGTIPRHFCMKLSNTGEYPGDYQRVFCWGKEDSLYCKSNLEKYSVEN